MEKEWIAVDWGTSNFRAWLIKGGEVLDECSANCGLLYIVPGQFDDTLKNLLGEWVADATPMILMAGMVGS